jgi:hypothetical protein
MTNRIRGEREVTLGQGKYVVALTMGACAALEAEFGVENFEAVFPQLADMILEKDENGKPRTREFKPRARAIQRFWTAVLTANGHDASEIANQVVNLYAAAGAAFDLLNTTREAWFAGDAPATGNEGPLADAPAGGTG